MFAIYLRVGTTTIEARYEPKKDATIIMTKPRELDERDNDEDEREIESRPIKVKLPGLVIPSLKTEQGSVKIIY